MPRDFRPIQIDPLPDLNAVTCSNCGRTGCRDVICNDCSSTPFCRPCNRRYTRGRGQWVILNGTDQWLCSTHWAESFFCCAHCSSTYPRTEGQSVIFCTRCFNRFAGKCWICGIEHELKSLFVISEGKLSCRDCNPLTLSQENKKNEDERLVGYELEFVSKCDPPVGRLGNLHDDGSLRAERGFYPREFSSSPQRQDALLESVEHVCRGLKYAQAQVNQTCGFHVHLDVSTLSKTELFRLRLWWGYFEDILFASLHPHRRNNSYAKTVHDESTRWAEDRYRSLNIAAKSKWGTYEVRMHEGTVDEKTVKAWILFLLAFFKTFSDLSLTRKRKTLMLKMNNRERLIFLFQQAKCPLSLRKHFIKKFKMFESYHIFKKAA